MFNVLAKNVATNTIQKLWSLWKTEEYDTDSAQQDIDINGEQINQSNILNEGESMKCKSLIQKYYKDVQRM